jgi:hypothetical protein
MTNHEKIENKIIKLFFIKAIRFSCSSSRPFASAVLHPRDIWQLKALFSVVFS